MSYIVFLSTKGLQMVQGNLSKNNIHISSCKEFEFVETNLNKLAQMKSKKRRQEIY